MNNSTITTLDEQQPPITAAAVKSATKPASKGRAQDASPEDSPAVIAGDNHDSQLSGDVVRLTIHASSDEGGQDAVPVGHNGYLYQIPRGKAWVVPKEVAQIIADAVTTSYKQGPAGGIVEINTPRYAYSIS